ncbi:MAG TPA: carbohydrate ABC transporter permease [Gaiellaceae bacterium]|jgi:multiple sugar transport system permease protein|nr:carbohydrate ABC transporter permease [Gaiellaceae bacterium]
MSTGALRRPATSRAIAIRAQAKRIAARIVLIVMAAAFLMPLYWMVVTALKGNQELTAFPPTLLPKHALWSNFVDAVEAIPFGRYFLNTLLVTVFSVLGAVVSSLAVAYGFSHIEWRGRDFLFYVVVASIFIPVPVTIVPLFILFAKLGWINTYLPLIVPMWLPALFPGPLYIFLLRQYLMQIPRELTDAARVDGAREWQVLRHVVLPLARPALAVVAIFAAVYAWNDFLPPLIYLQDDHKYTLAIGLQFYRSFYDVDFNLLMAASTLVILPLVVLFLLFQRQFIEGATAGSLK